jgi:predicted ATPase/DNA-binding NarL/FixJ family response regulator
MRGRRLSSVPLLPAPLIGREQELATARRALLFEGTRLLTLTGPPGVGKTSLALELAHGLADRFGHGAHLVDLAPIGDAELVASTIADALGVGGSAGRRPSERAIRSLREQQVLLILDNFEQVVEAAPLVAELLAACPRLSVLVTSRVPLRLRWEHELPVAPLSLPDLGGNPSAAALAQVPSVALFVERARAVLPGFRLGEDNARLIAELCVHLDGLPLAIELAAARIRLLPPEAIHARLAGAIPGRPNGEGSSPLRLLAAGPRDLPPRQQTLENAIAWSYDLLDAPEQVLFRRLAVFSGGCTFEAAESVCAFSSADASPIEEVLAALVEKSLLRQDVTAPDEPRLRMLETIREFALQQLGASGELELVQERHARFFLALAEQAEPELVGPQQAAWLDRLERDHDNLRAVARWATERGDGETVLRLGAALWRFWWMRSDAAEARERVEGVLALARAMPPSVSRIKALYGAGALAGQLGDYAAARELLEESLAIARVLGDRRGIASGLGRLGFVTYVQGRYVEARGLCEEGLAIFEELGDRASVGGVLETLGFIWYLEGDQRQARLVLEQSVAIARERGDRVAMLNALNPLGLTFHVERELDVAQRLYKECLELGCGIGDPHATAMTLNNLGNVATLQGDTPAARNMLRAALAVARSSGNRRRLAFILRALAGLVAAEGEPERAIRLDAAGLAAAEGMGAKLATAMEAIYAAQLEPARLALGEGAVAAAREIGQTMSLDRAVEEALAWLGDAEPAPQVAEAPAVAERPEREPPRRQVADRANLPAVSELTRREREVAALIGRGLTNREIAHELVLTEATAANYVQRVMNRLGLRRRSQVAAWAVEHHLHELPLGR